MLLRTRALKGRPYARAAASYGSWNSLSLRASQNTPLDQWRLLASASYQQSDGDFPFIDENGQSRIRENNDSRAGQVLLKLDRTLGAWRIGITNDAAVAFRGAPGMRQRPSDTARQRDLRHLLVLNASHYGLWRETDSLNLRLFHRYGHFRFDEPAAPPVLSSSHSSSPGAQGTLRASVAPHWSIEADMRLRAELLSDDDTGQRARALGDLAFSSKLGLWSDTVMLVPSAGFVSASDIGLAPVPKLGVLIAPWARSSRFSKGKLEFVVNAGRSYRFPTFQERFLRIEGFSSNPDLDPEDAIAIDAGLRWHFRGARLEFAGYRRWIDNLILIVPESSVRVRPQNFSGATAWGLEQSLSWQPALGLSVSGSYSYTRTRFSEPSLDLPGHPQHRFSGTLRWDAAACGPTAGSSWSMSLSLPRWLRSLSIWTQLSVQSAMALDRFNRITEAGRALVAAGGSYAYGRLRLALRGSNLTNKRDAVDTTGFPLAGASFDLSLALEI